MWSSIPGLNKETFYVTKTKECREKKIFVLSSSLRILDPYLCFESPRPSLGTLDFLSICLGVDSFKTTISLI